MERRDPDLEDSSVEQVLTYVRDGIISGYFSPNVKLLPKQIAESCGTSFIPVREALRALESEGFVNFVHNRGAFVTPLSMADLEDLYSVRIELECETVRHADRFTKAEIAHLMDILERSRQGHERGDNAMLVALNRELHFSIYGKANSPRRMKLIEQLWHHAARYQRLSLNYRHDASDAEHRRVVSKLRRGDHDGAADALRVHLETTVKLIRKQIEAVAAKSVTDLVKP
jgi:DNA-binding GntR family transcriptional regulator